jgi:hypothetical protein
MKSTSSSSSNNRRLQGWDCARRGAAAPPGCRPTGPDSEVGASLAGRLARWRCAAHGGPCPSEPSVSRTSSPGRPATCHRQCSHCGTRHWQCTQACSCSPSRPPGKRALAARAARASPDSESGREGPIITMSHSRRLRQPGPERLDRPGAIQLQVVELEVAVPVGLRACLRHSLRQQLAGQGSSGTASGTALAGQLRSESPSRLLRPCIRVSCLVRVCTSPATRAQAVSLRVSHY